MPITSVPLRPQRGYPGYPATNQPVQEQFFEAAAQLDFGLFVARGTADPTKVRLPQINSVTLTWDADFVSGNNITTTVNGTAVVVSFTSNQATTLAALVTAFEALTGVIADAASGTRTITLTASNDVALVVTGGTVTGGSSQAGCVITRASTDTLAGLTKAKVFGEQGITLANTVDGLLPATAGSPYLAGQAVPVLRRGSVFAVAGGSISAPGGLVYVSLAPATAGQVLSAASPTNGTITLSQSNIISDAAATEAVSVEINIP